MAISTSSNSNRHRLNHQIKSQQVRVVMHGQNLGVVSIKDALSLAINQGLDLVEIVPDADPPVCQIIDYGKFRYESKKKQRENKPKRIESKEVRLTPVIGSHDIETKVKQARTFLMEGRAVKVTVRYTRRQLSHLGEGRKVMDTFLAAVADIAKIESTPKMEGKNLSAQILPAKS